MDKTPHIGRYLAGEALLDAFLDEGEKELLKLDSGWAKAAYHFRTGIHLGHGIRNLRMRSLLAIYQELEVWKNRFDNGETLALLYAVGTCAKENLPLPTWLAREYESAFNRFLVLERDCHSLDDVFKSSNVPTQTPKKNAVAKQEWQLGCLLADSMSKLVMKNTNLQSFDAALDVVMTQRNWGVGKTKARELILMIDENQAELVPTYQCFSRFFELRRKL